MCIFGGKWALETVSKYTYLTVLKTTLEEKKRSNEARKIRWGCRGGSKVIPYGFDL